MLILWPNRVDASSLYTPTGSGGSWLGTLPLTNLQDSDLSLPARSASAFLRDTRTTWDMMTSRALRGVVFPKSNLSSAGLFRVTLWPSMLFNYTAGDDIAALGGTHTRTPTATVRAATYVDRNGVVQYAGENRWLGSADANDAANTLTSVTVTTNTVVGPTGTSVNADTLTATGSNGTHKQAITTTAVSWTFSVWLKRKTGSGNIDITMDGTTWVTQAVTTTWQRFSVTQTGVAGTSNPGVRIATSGDAVYWRDAQAQIGSLTAYLPTTSAAVSALRDEHWVGNVRTVLTEPAGTNLCLQSSNLGTTWSAVGTPTRSAAAASSGVLDLDLIGDDNGAALEGYTQAITFTGDAVKALSFFIRQGTSTSTVLRLRDTSASANRALVAVTWSAGLPVVTATTGTALGYQSITDDDGNDAFRVLIQSTSVTAANTNQIEIYPATDASLATASTGNVYVGGFQAENAAAPGSLIVTTTATVTRAADALSFTWAGGNPQAMSAYVDFYDQGGAARGTAATCYALWLGAASASAPRFDIRQDSPNGRETVAHNNNVDATVSSLATTTATYGQRVEAVGTLASTGAVQLLRALDGAAFTSATASSAPASGLAAAWAGSVLTIGARGDAANHCPMALRSVRIVAGVQTGAYMQTVVSDSGWLDAWPSGEDAETTAGMNLPLAYLLDAEFDARYLSVQIHDPANLDGYVDLHRLLAGPGFEPLGMDYGASIGVQTSSRRERARSGKAFYEVQPRYRYAEFQLSWLSESEAMVNVLDFQRLAGIHDQFYYLWDEEDETHRHRTSFLGTLEQLGTVRRTDYDRRAVSWRVTEEI